MAFTQQDVLEAYHLLNHGQTPDIKKKADDYLNQFLVASSDSRPRTQPGFCAES